MRKTISLITIISLAAAPAAFAANSSREENIGVGSGAIIGALAGGPVGFFVGAALGAKAGDTVQKKNASLRNLSADYDAVSAELESLRPVARPELVSMLQAGINMDLLFRTDEHVLSDATTERLAALATMLATMPDIRVQLDGFADERGDAAYNHELSAQRVEFVRSQLLAAGVGATRIRAAAHGEVPAQDASADSYALERRVSLTLYLDDTPAVAQLPR